MLAFFVRRYATIRVVLKMRSLHGGGKLIFRQSHHPGLEIAVLDQSLSHKWFGCMLPTFNANGKTLSTNCKVWPVRFMLRIASRLTCLMLWLHSWFDLQRAGHRKIYRNVRKLDVLWVCNLTSIGTVALKFFTRGTTGWWFFLTEPQCQDMAS